MRLNSMCIRCLVDKQEAGIAKFKDEEKNTAYMKEIAKIIGESDDEASSAYLVYLFNQVYRRYFGEVKDYSEIKKEYNSYVLAMEDELYQEIGEAKDPLAQSIVYARIGNYIDFGAMQHVERAEFLELFQEKEKNLLDQSVYEDFLKDCQKGKNFLLLADNCGEIVLDKLFLRELKKRFPHLILSVMVRGEEVLNDVTIKDAEETGICTVAKVVSNGNGVGGTVVDMLSEEARQVLDQADVMLAKGQANFETLHGCGRNIYYSFLCKCDWFSGRFGVEKYTGMFLRERDCV
ncbi:MAG: DUF89 family protein [Lachnospiraceae bacterium]|nr:DUF89 family protein [Lachnospiraceae bacterium]